MKPIFKCSTTVTVETRDGKPALVLSDRPGGVEAIVLDRDLAREIAVKLYYWEDDHASD